MTEAQVCVAALAAGLAALGAIAVPWWFLLIAVAAAAVTRRPAVVVLVVALICGVRAHTALAALKGERAASVTTTVTVLSDPVARFGRWSFDVRRGAEHDQADLAMRAAVPEVGERLNVRGRLLSLPEDGWARARHLRARLRIDAVRSRHEPTAVLRVVNGLRRRLSDAAASTGDRRPLLVGILFGDDRAQPAAQVQRFRVAGLSHLLAVSGQNVAFMLVVAAPLVRRGRLGWRWLASMAVLGGFTLLTRAEPSVLRAVAMAVVVVTAQVTGRAASPLRVLGTAVVALSVIDPLLWWSAGFQLSVAATASLIVVRPVIARRLRGPRWLREAIAVVLAAQLGTFPLLATMGATVSVATLAANLVAVPVAGGVMVWGFSGGAVAMLMPPAVATGLHLPTRAMLWWIDSVANWAASPRWPLLGPVSFAVLVAAAGAAVARPRWVAMLGRSVLAAWLVVVMLPAPAGTWSCDPGVRVWRGQPDAVVMSIAGTARDATIRECMASHRIARIDLLVLGAPGAAATRQAVAVREAAAVGTVVAVGGRVRGAVALREGAWRVGPLRVQVRRGEGGWGVRVG